MFKIPSSVVLQQVRFVDPLAHLDQYADVLIVEGKLESINPGNITTEIERLDAQGLILAPALIDLYSTLSQPGHEERETLSSLLKACQAGGIGELNLFSQILDQPAHIALSGQLLRAENSPVKVNFWASPCTDKKLNNLLELSQAGIIGFLINNHLENLTLLRRVLEYLKPTGLTLALTPLDRSLSNEGVMREGIQAIRLGLQGVPCYAETAALSSILQIVEEVGSSVHFMRISTAKSVDLIAQAKRQGLPVTASTTWLHLLLTSEAINSYNANLRLEPPLGNPVDRSALIGAIRSGIIDAIAIDHTPYTYEEKTVAFAEAPPGAIGMELALPALYQELVITQQLSALELWQALSVNPLGCIEKSLKRIDSWILFDPNKKWKVDQLSLNSLSHNTHLLGKQIQGQVIGSFYGFN